MVSFTTLTTLAMSVSFAFGLAFPGGGPSSPSKSGGSINAPECGGDQAVCCTGSYTAEGETVDNCITYTNQNSVCSTSSNVYCCYTCAEPIGSCVGCSHFY